MAHHMTRNKKRNKEYEKRNAKENFQRREFE